MKNINKHKTPQDKMRAWCHWMESNEGCNKCNLGSDNKKYCTPEMKIICFNAYLHSTTNENKK